MWTGIKVKPIQESKDIYISQVYNPLTVQTRMLQNYCQYLLFYLALQTSILGPQKFLLLP